MQIERSGSGPAARLQNGAKADGTVPTEVWGRALEKSHKMYFFSHTGAPR